MKKSVCYLLTVICSLLFFISCENNKPEDIPHVIKGGIFEGDRLVLTINGEVTTGRSVDMRASYGYTSDMIIQGFMVEGTTPVITFTAKEIANGLQISESLNLGMYDIEIEGTILRSASSVEILTLNVTYENNAAIIGHWVYEKPYILLKAEDGILFEEDEVAVPVEEIIQFYENMLETYLPQMDVLSFQPNGDLDVAYTPLSTGQTLYLTPLTTFYAIGELCVIELGGLVTSLPPVLVRSEITINHHLYCTCQIEGDKIVFYTKKNHLLGLSQMFNVLASQLGRFDERIAEYLKKLYFISLQADEFEIGFHLQRKGS